MQASPIRIGTRGSPLALAQAHQVRDLLLSAQGLSPGRIEVITIKTSGDRIQDRPLSEVGGKGLFTKEIEEALKDGAIDLAVHSAKDVATKLPPGLGVGAVLEREDVRDAFISLKHASLADLPPGAKVGTSSLRRQAQVRRARPDLQVIEFRGNVETRLAKLEAGVAAATFLAAAGLNRLNAAQRITSHVETSLMLPAVAQAAIMIEIREDDHEIRQLVGALDHQPTALCVATERAFLARLDGSCRTPIAGLAQLVDGRLSMKGELLAPDGSISFIAERAGAPASALDLGVRVAEALIEDAGAGFLAQFVPGAR
ncbi:MAG: hydroxymethylbilane synthase [Hyphomicrobiaceae bacterium]